MSDLDKMTKAQLESHARTLGVELDRRETRAKLITQLKRIVSSAPVEIIEEDEVESPTEQSPLESKKETTEAEVSAAKQAVKDARRMAERAVESHIQAVNMADILTKRAAAAQTLADDATRKVEVLLEAVSTAKEAAVKQSDRLELMVTGNP